jgi:hypothetical protein
MTDKLEGILRKQDQTWPVTLLPGIGHIPLTLDAGAVNASVKAVEAMSRRRGLTLLLRAIVPDVKAKLRCSLSRKPTGRYGARSACRLRAVAADRPRKRLPIALIIHLFSRPAISGGPNR